MKIYTTIILTAIAIFAIGCSKDDDPQTYAIDPNLLAKTYTNNTQMPIPDVGNVASEIDIEGEGSIADASKVTISVSLRHAFSSDVIIELIAPDGEATALVKRVGGTHDYVFGNILNFNAAFETIIAPGANETVIAGGNYAPSEGDRPDPANAIVNDLESFLNGKNLDGTWTLRIRDYISGGVGDLEFWQMKFEPGAVE